MPISPVLFRNQFENTVSPFGWSGELASAGCSDVVEAVRPHHGAYNFRATLGANLGGGLFARVYYGSLGNAYRHLCCRIMNASVDVLPEDATDFYRHIAFANSTGATIVAAYGIINVVGTNYWYMRVRNAAVFSDSISTLSPVANTLYCLEVEILQSTAGNADGYQKMYVDGNLAVSALNLDNDDRTLDYVLLGQISSAAPDLSAVNFRCDCAEISRSYIGQERFTAQCHGRGPDARRAMSYPSSMRAGTKQHLH